MVVLTELGQTDSVKDNKVDWINWTLRDYLVDIFSLNNFVHLFWKEKLNFTPILRKRGICVNNWGISNCKRLCRNGPS